METSVSLRRGDADARERDANDPLARFRDEFYLPEGRIYLDGNSLGPLSRRSEDSLRRVLEDWKTLGVAGWTEAMPPWFTLAEELGRRMAPLVGADPEEVVVANSTTVNLHQCLATLYRPRDPRTKILVDELIFPTDLHAVRSHLQLRGLDPEEHIVTVRSGDGYSLSEAEAVGAMSDGVQMVMLPSVIYRSGQLLDMELLAREAHARGVTIGFDCSHSAGTIPHRLAAWGVDFAVWSTYKYLNAGPGAAAGLFLSRRHFGTAPGLAGWFGSRKDRQFEMSGTLDPAPHAGALQIGTPQILSMAPLLGALDMIAEAGSDAIRRKSLELTSYLMTLVEEELGDHGFAFANPREDARRGGHVALVHPEALRLGKALRAAGVVTDFRPPDIVRLAPVALYVRFQDCYEAVRRLKAIMVRRDYERVSTGPDIVT